MDYLDKSLNIRLQESVVGLPTESGATCKLCLLNEDREKKVMNVVAPPGVIFALFIEIYSKGQYSGTAVK